jgi:hypothetical protein
MSLAEGFPPPAEYGRNTTMTGPKASAESVTILSKLRPINLIRSSATLPWWHQNNQDTIFLEIFRMPLHGCLDSTPERIVIGPLKEDAHIIPLRRVPRKLRLDVTVFGVSMPTLASPNQTPFLPNGSLEGAGSSKHIPVHAIGQLVSRSDEIEHNNREDGRNKRSNK